MINLYNKKNINQKCVVFACVRACKDCPFPVKGLSMYYVKGGLRAGVRVREFGGAYQLRDRNITG